MMAYLQENDSVNMPFWIKKKERLGKRMYRKKSRGWYKHKDFILIDLACLFMALILAYLIRNGSAKCRAFLNFIMKIKGVAENIDENSC